MKKITIELPDGYDEVLSITAMGRTIGLSKDGVNVMSRVFELTGHDGDVLVIHPDDNPAEWRKPETDWIPVWERLPERGEDVLAWGHKRLIFGEHAVIGQFSGAATNPSVWYWKDSLKTITHWMPLPEPPEV